MKKDFFLIITLSVLTVLVTTTCSPVEEETDKWPNTDGYSHINNTSLSKAKEDKLTVYPNQKFYSAGFFNDMFGRSEYCAITPDQDCIIKIDFQKFNFGFLSLSLNDIFISYSDTINITTNDVLVFEANSGGAFSVFSGYDFMYGFSVIKAEEESCDIRHSYKWIVIIATYPATSEEICTRCNIPSGASLRITKEGDIGPAGGKIFYVSTTGFDFYTGNDESKTIAHYLETDLNDGISLKWATRGAPPYAVISDLANATTIGTGKRNTALILEGDPTAPAALYCVNYKAGGMNDWFLPSKDELNELYKQKNLFGTTSRFFWSSSQNSENEAWDQTFLGGNQYSWSKGSSTSVRAIRAF